MHFQYWKQNSIQFLRQYFLFEKKSGKQEKACKRKINYPINIKLPGAIRQMMSNTCTYFQKILRACVDKYHVHRRRTDRRTSRQTDRLKQTFVCWGYKDRWDKLTYIYLVYPHETTVDNISSR